MKRVTKIIAALLLMTAVVWAVGFTKNNESPSMSESNGSYNGHEYVDLGLPSGLLWATCNIGANKPEDYGNYFAWGETEAKDTYYWSTYKWCNGDYDQPTKYCSNSSYGYNGFTDTLTILLPEDDAATANWGNGWRIASETEWQELLDNTTHLWMTRNGVNGLIFIASNGASLFLPAAGYRDLSIYGGNGNYWSSSLRTGYPGDARCLYFSSGDCYVSNSYRSDGFSVRPVCSARQN